MRALKAEEIQCRAQIVKEKGWSVLLYKDARCDMNILDEVFGQNEWKCHYEGINENLFCTVSIWDKEKSQWISKQDAGSESNTEAQKGHASDAFKRACFRWGIGRELYTAPFIWITAKSGEVYKRGEKFAIKSSVNLYVKSITTKEGIITALEIVDGLGVTRFKMGSKNEKEWLGEGHPHFEAVVHKFKHNEVDLDEIKQHYKLSKLTEEYFQSLNN